MSGESLALLSTVFPPKLVGLPKPRRRLSYEKPGSYFETNVYCNEIYIN